MENSIMRKRAVTLKWSYPIKYNNASNEEICSQSEIYYISRVFGGHEASIYIGKTVDYFINLMKTHDENWLKMPEWKKSKSSY